MNSNGIAAYAAYLPHWRIERSQIAEALSGESGGTGGAGKSGGDGETRRAAGFDEDTTTMGVEAARLVLKSLSKMGGKSGKTRDGIQNLWFSTAEPAYLEKTNAGAIHAALRLDESAAALDFGGASRSGIGALKNALQNNSQDNSQTNGQNPSTLIVLSGLRTGRPGSYDESFGGDGAAAFLTAPAPTSKKAGENLKSIADYLGGASATREFLDRWRLPGDAHTSQWEERFGEHAYDSLVENALKAALGNAELNLEDIDKAAVAGTHQRAANKAKKLIQPEKLADDLLGEIGNTGAAHPGLLLTSMLDTAEPNQTLAVIWLADGVEVAIFKTTKEIQNYEPAAPLASQLKQSGIVSYMDFLKWRGFIKAQPSNRPEPPRISAPAALRGSEWKFSLHLPPPRISISEGDSPDEIEMIPAPMADTPATIATFTIDRLAYSESPPVIFAVVDFDGGGRFPVELTDVDESEVEIGMKVEMTFRRLYTADGIHNYFYKARPQK